MKHLKLYNEEFNWKNLNPFNRKKKYSLPEPQFDIFDLQDICLELEDVGFNVDISLKTRINLQDSGYDSIPLMPNIGQDYTKWKYITVKINLKDSNGRATKQFYFSEIYEVVARIEDFIKTWDKKIIDIKEFTRNSKKYHRTTIKDLTLGMKAKVDDTMTGIDYHGNKIWEIFQLSLTLENPIFKLGKYNESKKSKKRINIQNEIINNIKDILLELNDQRFHTEVKSIGNDDVINISKDRHVFKYKDIEEVILRLRDYLGSVGYELPLYARIKIIYTRARAHMMNIE